VAASIVTVIATSSAAASANVERGTANMRLGMTLEVATAAGAIAGGAIAGLLAASTLEGVFAVVLIPTALLMWRRGEAGPGGAELPNAADPGLLGGRYADAGATVVYRVRRLWAGMSVAFVAGNLSGMLGIGGGAFKVPALNLLCAVPIKAAAATSNFMIGVTAAASAFLYYGRGDVRPGVTASAVLGVLVGSSVGAAISPRIRGASIRKLFAAMLGLVAVQMLYRAIAGGGP
jgi:uncharacterized membrane protein YfcA